VKPYPISYRAIVPKEKECSNLLVPVCLSATHAAYGSIRMEPVFMMLGQASAYAASLAIDENKSVQSIPPAKISERVGAAELVAAIKPASEDEAKPGTPSPTTEKDRFLGAVANLRKAQAFKGDTQWLETMKTTGTIEGEKGAAYRLRLAHQNGGQRGRRARPPRLGENPAGCQRLLEGQRPRREILRSTAGEAALPAAGPVAEERLIIHFLGIITANG
jgi:predicted secreted protein